MKRLLRYLSYGGQLLARLVLFPLYFLSGLVRRRPDLWVFGSWGGYRFADNSSAFFLYCQERIADRVRLVWISRDRRIVAALRADGYEAHWIASPRGLLCCLRAGVYLFDSFSKDINHWTSRGATLVNLWSGVPLKAIERDIDNPRSRYYRLFHGTWPERLLLGIMMPWHVVRPDLIIATSKELAAITRRAFDVPEDAVVVTGFPRNDVLFASARNRRLPEAFQQALDEGRTVFFYLPTYRDSGKPYFNLDTAELDRLMEELHATFFFKLHPNDQSTFEGARRRVVELPQGIDIYDLMARTDVLISDYSSIIFDFMLLDRPIIHYLPDLEEFIASSRSLYFDPREIAVGPVCTAPDGLLRALAEVARGEATPAAKREEWNKVRARVNLHADGESNRRVLEVIERRVLGDSLPARAPARPQAEWEPSPGERKIRGIGK